MSVYKDFTPADITCMCLDDRMRKLFVGDARGRTYCLNAKNGVMTKRFRKPHDNKYAREVAA